MFLHCSSFSLKMMHLGDFETDFLLIYLLTQPLTLLGRSQFSTRGRSLHLCRSVHACAFWTGPGVKGSANTLSLSAARVITPG